MNIGLQYVSKLFSVACTLTAVRFEEQSESYEFDTNAINDINARPLADTCMPFF